MKFKEGDLFWTLTIEPPGVQSKKVYGTICYYSKSRGSYNVKWDRGTTELWIKWTNNRMYEKNMNHIE